MEQQCELYNFESLDGYVEIASEHSAHLIIDGDTIECGIVPGLATTLAPYIPGKQLLRFSGRIHWHRNASGKWEVLNFHVMYAEALDDTPLSQVVAKLRTVTAETRLGESPN